MIKGQHRSTLVPIHSTGALDAGTLRAFNAQVQTASQVFVLRPKTNSICCQRHHSPSPDTFSMAAD